MSRPTVYLFDGSNLFHAGRFVDRDHLVNSLASFVAEHGAHGIVVFDGVGADREVGALRVCHASHADTVLERLAAERRETVHVILVTSDSAVRSTSGHAVEQRASEAFLAQLERSGPGDARPARLADRLDAETWERLERLRRGGS